MPFCMAYIPLRLAKYDIYVYIYHLHPCPFREWDTEWVNRWAHQWVNKQKRLLFVVHFCIELSPCVLTHSSERQGADREVHKTVIGQQSSTGGLVSHFVYHLYKEELCFAHESESTHCPCRDLHLLTTLLCICMCAVSVVRYLVIWWEDVEGQRFLSLIDELDRFIHPADWQDGKQRSKYLLLHHLRLRLHVTQNCGGYTQHTNTFAQLSAWKP